MEWVTGPHLRFQMLMAKPPGQLHVNSALIVCGLVVLGGAGVDCGESTEGGTSI